MHIPVNGVQGNNGTLHTESQPLGVAELPSRFSDNPRVGVMDVDDLN